MAEGMVIVGAGEAGARAAISLRERGFTGLITLVGGEAHDPYERPPLSKAVITSQVHPDVPTVVLDASRRQSLSIDLLSNIRATAIDRLEKTVNLSDGSAIRYSKLLLATGCLPRQLSVAGGSGGHVFYLRTFSDALKLRHKLQPATKLVVIGGGFIGLEIAASAIARGCAVTLLETGERLLSRGVPRVVADRVAASHRKAGVEILTSVTIEEVSERDGRPTVHLQNGSVLSCDLIVAGIGAIPETHLAAGCGLTVDNGICVDQFLQTADPNVFSAGDCCSFPHRLYGNRRIRLEAWRNAQEQGALAADNMLGGSTPYAAVPWFWSDQYDETLQVAGLYDADCWTIERRIGEAASVYFHLNPNGRLVAASAIGPNAVIAKDIRVAEMLIALEASPSAGDLQNASFKLRDLLKAATTSA